MGVTQKVVDFILDVNYGNIPEEAVKRAKRCIIDCLGVTLAGSVNPISKILKNYLGFVGCRQQSTVIGLGLKSSLPLAAFANGTLGNVLDYNDSIWTYLGHPTISILPAVLSVGEFNMCNGKDMLTAFSVGFEVESKIGRATHPSTRKRGFQTTGTVGTFGAVAAAGKLLGLDSEKMLNAFGIAGSEASGLSENIGTMTNAFHAGRAAENGVLAALLAREGFTGTKSILEGKEGFCRVLSDSCNLDKITENLGYSWDILNPGPALKLYPCCGGISPALDVMISMTKEYDWRPEDVESVRCGINSLEARINRYNSPKTALEAKWSFQFCLAIALLKRQVTINEVTDEMVHDPEVVELMKKIEVYVDPQRDKLSVAVEDDYSRPQPGWLVQVKTKDGRLYSRQLEDWSMKKGGPKNPLSDEDLIAKYKACAGQVLPVEKIDRSIELMMQLETTENIARLMELVRAD